MRFLEFLKEGKLKRSDPVISGDVEFLRQPVRTRKTPFQVMISNLAAKAKVPEAEVELAWREIKAKTDINQPGAYASIMVKLKQRLKVNG